MLAAMQQTYEPNSKGAWQQQPDFSEPPLATGGAAAHWDHRANNDYYTQPGDLFRLMTPEQQQLLFENTARSVGGASKQIQQGISPTAPGPIRLTARE